MICFIFVLIIFQNFKVATCACKHVYFHQRSIFDSQYRHNYIGSILSKCYISQIYQPTNLYSLPNMLSGSDQSDYYNNTIHLEIENSMITDFASNIFINEDIACYYGRIHLVVNNSHISRISSLNTVVLQLRSHYKISGAKCNVSYESIEFPNNNITQVDSSIFNNMPNLTLIDLSHNRIDQLNRLQFTNLPWLKRLVLSNNNIPEIGLAFGQLNNMSTLEMAGNNITSLTKNTFINITNLIILDLSENQLTNIASGTFIYLNKLVLLKLSGNKLATIDIGTFSGLHNLAFLYLGKNHLVINKYLLINTPKLDMLDISFNGLQYLDTDIFGTYMLNKINIDGNNFSCQHLIHLIHEFRQMGTAIVMGTEKDRVSLLGMHCNDTEANEDIVINVGNKQPINDLSQFFHQGFKETSFYKFFQNFAVTQTKPIDNGAYKDALKSLEDSSKQIASAMNSTMLHILMKLQATEEGNNYTGEQRLNDMHTERPILEALLKLNQEIKRFDNSSDKLNKIVSEKLTWQPEVNKEKGIFHLLVVVICLLVIIVIMQIVQFTLKKYDMFKILNARRANMDYGVSRSELCTMTDTL